jgi:hypothetical protein
MTLGLQHLQLPDMGERCGSSQETSIIHHEADELLIEQDSVSDGQITLLVQEGTQYSQTLGNILPDLIDVRGPGKSCI